MIVKGSKQLGSFRRGINLYVPKRVQSAPPEQVIWKVAIFNAGQYGGEYIWDGTTLENGKPLYTGPVDAESELPYTIQWSADDNLWYVINEGEQIDIAQSLDSWQNFSSALSYSQNSFIDGFELDGDVAQTYSRSSGGNTTFTSGEPEYYVMVDGQSWFAYNGSISAEELYSSQNSGFTWEIVAGNLPVPNISAITYSA